MNYQEALSNWRGDGSGDIPLRDDKYVHVFQEHLRSRTTGLLNGFHYCCMIQALQPAPSEDKGATMIAVWENAAKRARGIRLRTRPGKAFKRLFPWLDQTEIAELADWYRELMLLENAELIVKDSLDAADFKRAYAGEQAPMANPSASSSRKSLAFSCMRDSFDDLPSHPAEVYASGDFTIAWAETNGLIAGRCVIYNKKAGPIYGVSDTAIDALESHVYEKLGATKYMEHNGWSGAKLQKIKYNGGFLAPYIDVNPSSVTDSGSSLIIADDGEYEADNVDGTLSENENFTLCGHCSCRVDENETCHHDDGDGPYCQECFDQIYSMCEHCESYESADDVTLVHIANSRWGQSEEYWCESCVSDSASLCVDDGEYWHDDDVVKTHDGETISPAAIEGGEYSDCVLTGEIYHFDNLGTLANGDGSASIEYMKTDGNWKENDDGEWENIQSELGLASIDVAA